MFIMLEISKYLNDNTGILNRFGSICKYLFLGNIIRDHIAFCGHCNFMSDVHNWPWSCAFCYIILPLALKSFEIIATVQK